MRKIPFKDETFSFVYTWNAIHMMSKEDAAQAVSEIERVMKAKGLCFVNFVSTDEPPPTDARAACYNSSKCLTESLLESLRFISDLSNSACKQKNDVEKVCKKPVARATKASTSVLPIGMLEIVEGSSYQNLLSSPNIITSNSSSN